MSDSNINLIVSYYDAVNRQDAEAVAAHFHPEISFLSPLSECSGKEEFMEVVRGKFLPATDRVEIRAKMASGDQVMIAYDLHCKQPVCVVRSAALFTFKDSLISRLELFFDPGAHF